MNINDPFVQQELALLADLVRETVVGLSRSAEKLNSVLTISQRMQTANVEQRRTLLAPRPRTLNHSPQDRANRSVLRSSLSHPMTHLFRRI